MMRNIVSYVDIWFILHNMCPYIVLWIYNEKNFVIQFADDTVIFISAKNVDSIEFMLSEGLKNVFLS